MKYRGKIALVFFLMVVATALLYFYVRQQRKLLRLGAQSIRVSRAIPTGRELKEPVLDYEIVAKYPHDPKAFTQGLLYHDDFLFESTGGRGRSELRRVALPAGKVQVASKLDSSLFGEGLALNKGLLYQLTWTSGVLRVYRVHDLGLEREQRFEGIGWGITTVDSSLVTSDGSATLSFRDPETFAIQRKVEVTASGFPVKNLNELEFVEGKIFANIWMTNYVACIDPETGRVDSWVNLNGLLSKDESKRADVLNGIAYDSVGKRLFVTGKLWPSLFEIQLQDPDKAGKSSRLPSDH